MITHDFIDTLNKENIHDNPIVTRVTPASKFYVAELYHQDYYNQNTSHPYCSYVIAPKVDKARSIFKSKVKNK